MNDDTAKKALIYRRLVRNTISNYVGTLIVLGTGLFLTPFTLHHLGAGNFGLWAVVGSAIVYGSLLDCGIAGTVVKYIAEYRAKGEIGEANSLIATALCIYSALGFVVLAITGAIAPFVPDLFIVLPDKQATVTWLVILVGLRIGISIPCTTTMAVLRGLQRYDLVNLINGGGMLLSAAATVVLLLFGGGVLGLVAVSIAVTLAIQASSIWFIHTIMPELRINWRGAKRRMVRTVISFSSPLFVTQFSGSLQTKTDEFVIAAWLPLSAVAPYVIARRLSELAQILADQLIKVLLPLASQLNVEDDKARLRSLYLASTRVTLAIFLPVGCTLVVLAGPIITAWVGPVYAEYAHLVIILSFASLITTSMWPAASIIQSMARHRPLAVMSLGSGLANLALSIALVHRFGLMGVALGTLVPTAIESFGFVLPYTMRVIGVSFSEVVDEILLPAWLPVAPMALILYVFHLLIEPSSLSHILMAAGLGMLVYALGYLSMGASKHERQACRSIVGSTLRFVEARFK